MQTQISFQELLRNCKELSCPPLQFAVAPPQPPRHSSSFKKNQPEPTSPAHHHLSLLEAQIDVATAELLQLKAQKLALLDARLETEFVHRCLHLSSSRSSLSSENDCEF